MCRFCSCPKQFTFFITPLNLVDLLAILPFYISLILGQGKIDPFGCRDDLDIDGNFFNQSAVGADDGSGIPNLGFLRVVRGATPPQHSTHLHPRLDRSTAPTCSA